ncbi:MAG: invasion associated locus B family protein [Candidatus Puniceispirillales bacterium WSBS_2018_MAG_OTU23]
MNVKNIIIAIGILMMGFALTAPAYAQKAGVLIGQSGGWKSYRMGAGADVVCFITSEPIKLEGKYDRKNRGETRVFVTHHGKGGDNRGTVSSVAGYRFEEGRDVVFNIDGKGFNLFSVDTRAWATKPEQDRALVTAMKRGQRLKITGYSSRGNKTVDTYSLKGFTAAMKKIDGACS